MKNLLKGSYKHHCTNEYLIRYFSTLVRRARRPVPLSDSQICQNLAKNFGGIIEKSWDPNQTVIRLNALLERFGTNTGAFWWRN